MSNVAVLALVVGLCFAPAFLVGLVTGLKSFFIAFGLLLALSPVAPIAVCVLYPNESCVALPWFSLLGVLTLTPAGVVLFLGAFAIPSKKKDSRTQEGKRALCPKCGRETSLSLRSCQQCGAIFAA
jgi:hypothetical protein